MKSQSGAFIEGVVPKWCLLQWLSLVTQSLDLTQKALGQNSHPQIEFGGACQAKLRTRAARRLSVHSARSTDAAGQCASHRRACTPCEITDMQWIHTHLIVVLAPGDIENCPIEGRVARRLEDCSRGGMPNELPSAAHNSAESQLRRDDMPLASVISECHKQQTKMSRKYNFYLFFTISMKKKIFENCTLCASLGQCSVWLRSLGARVGANVPSVWGNLGRRDLRSFCRRRSISRSGLQVGEVLKVVIIAQFCAYSCACSSLRSACSAEPVVLWPRWPVLHELSLVHGDPWVCLIFRVGWRDSHACMAVSRAH